MNTLTKQGNTIKETSVSVSGASHNHGEYTGYTQPTFKGTEVTSKGASTETVTISDPGHRHPQNIPSPSNVDWEAMVSNTKTGGGVSGRTNDGSVASPVTNRYRISTNSVATGITAKHPHTHKVTASGTVENHRHSITSSGDLSMSGTIGNGNTETRPDNYTIKVWKRTA